MGIAMNAYVKSLAIHFPRWLSTGEGLRLLCLLAAGLALRLLLAPFLHLTFDLEAYAYWGALIREHFLNTYSYGGMNTQWVLLPAYPPLTMYLYGALEAVYFGVAHLFGFSPTLGLPPTGELDATQRLVFKLPQILADMGLVAIIYAIAQRRLTSGRALLVAATYAFSPAVLIVLLLWGQTDSIALLLVVASLLLAVRCQGLWAGVFIALAVAIKPQPAIFIPLVVLYLFRWAGWKAAARGVGGIAGVSALVWLPYLLPPSYEILSWARNVSVVEQVEGMGASRSAYNLWWVTGLQNYPANQSLVGPLTPHLLGYGLFGLFLLAILAGIWRDSSLGRLWAGAGLAALAYFDVTTLQWERYVFPAIGFFLLAALYDRRYWVCYAAVSVTAFTGLITTVNYCNCGGFPFSVPPLVYKVLMLHLQGWRGGLVNIGILVVAMVIYIRVRDERASNVAAVGTAGTALIAVSDTNGQRVAHLASADRVMTRHLDRDPYVSVVIPCYNEEGNIQAMYERLTRTLVPITSTYELIFVNNGSYDGSAAIFDSLVATDEHVSVLTLSRNFQSQGAYTSGMEYASGDCVVCLDGDIQDPPELIPTFLERWREGYDVVYGVRVRRKGSFLRRIGYKAFYRLLHKVSYIQVPIDAGDFGLMDRRVVDAVNAMPERSRLIRGLRAWVGFHQVGVPYTRDERFSGRTTNSIRGLFHWASLGIVSFSYAPLDLISYLAAFVVGLSAVALVVYTALYFIVPDAPRGFETLLVVTLFLGAVQLLCMSIIGTYLARMFEEIKARPKYLIQDVQNNHRVQQTNTIQRHASAEMAANGSGAIEHPPVATVSNTVAARAPLD